jgi:hypothetical protein
VVSRGLPSFIGKIPPLKHNAFFRVWQPLSPPIAAAALLLHCARRFTADNRGTLGHMPCFTRPDADKVYGDLNFCHRLGSTIFPFRRCLLGPPRHARHGVGYSNLAPSRCSKALETQFCVATGHEARRLSRWLPGPRSVRLSGQSSRDRLPPRATEAQGQVCHTPSIPGDYHCPIRSAAVSCVGDAGAMPRGIGPLPQGASKVIVAKCDILGRSPELADGCFPDDAAAELRHYKKRWAASSAAKRFSRVQPSWGS